MRGLVPRTAPRIAALVAAAGVVLAAVIAVPRLRGSDGRTHSAGDVFSVVLPAGWRLDSTTASPTGRMTLVGPRARRIEIDWANGSIDDGFDNGTPTVRRTIPVTIAGQSTTLADYVFPGPDDPRSRAGYIHHVTHRVGASDVGFIVTCDQAGPDDDDYTACLAVLASWRWS